MNTYLMFGKYSSEALKGINSKRTGEAHRLLNENGGEIIAQYTLLGENDLLFIVNFPLAEEVIKSSVALSKLPVFHFIVFRQSLLNNLIKLFNNFLESCLKIAGVQFNQKIH